MGHFKNIFEVLTVPLSCYLYIWSYDSAISIVTRLQTGINKVLNLVGARELSTEHADRLQHPTIQGASAFISLG